MKGLKKKIQVLYYRAEKNLKQSVQSTAKNALGWKIKRHMEADSLLYVHHNKTEF